MKTGSPTVYTMHQELADILRGRLLNLEKYFVLSAKVVSEMVDKSDCFWHSEGVRDLGI